MLRLVFRYALIPLSIILFLEQFKIFSLTSIIQVNVFLIGALVLGVFGVMSALAIQHNVIRGGLGFAVSLPAAFFLLPQYMPAVVSLHTELGVAVGLLVGGLLEWKF